MIDCSMCRYGYEIELDVDNENTPLTLICGKDLHKVDVSMIGTRVEKLNNLMIDCPIVKEHFERIRNIERMVEKIYNNIDEKELGEIRYCTYCGEKLEKINISGDEITCPICNKVIGLMRD